MSSHHRNILNKTSVFASYFGLGLCVASLVPLPYGSGAFASSLPTAASSPTPAASPVAAAPIATPKPTPKSTGQTPATSAPGANGISFDRMENGVIYFSGKLKDGQSVPPLKTGLYDLTYLGTLKPDEANYYPYFLFSGRTCENCIQDKAIYAFRPTGGKPTTFVYPGKIFDSKSRALLIESRAFFGDCVRGRGEAYVVFQRERVDRRRALQPSVFIAEPGPDYFSEQLLERHLPSVNETLRRVKRKTCREISGTNRIMLRKPLTTPDRRNLDEDDDENDQPHENQTDRDMSS